MKTILTVVGARPQFIKAAAVSRVLQSEPYFEEHLVHTGQHFDQNMSEIFFKELGIPAPRYDLGISGGTHGQMTGEMLKQLEQTMIAVKPDLVIVYGDTNSTLAGALAASKLHIPLAHIEAGLRSFNKQMPEEINRILTDHCADFLFTPTETATQHLLKEGFQPSVITQVGDVMFDVARYAKGLAAHKRQLLTDLKVSEQNYILATIHRQENTDSRDRLSTIFEAFNRISEEYPIILPLHPRTKKRLSEYQLDSLLSKLIITPPLGYLEMVTLECNAALIVTDSGGVQKEAFFHKIPCVTLRDETEWTELVESGWNRLITPQDSLEIFNQTLKAIGTHGEQIAPYGVGHAADLIVSRLKAILD